jgi:molybdopterin-guanine dinucleotide biosynthesis protein A
MTVSGIVLAGGASRRFGADKLAESIDGVTLLDRAIQALAGLVDEVVVVLAPGRPAPILGPASTGPAGPGPAVRHVHDPEPFSGPLAGLRTGLRAAAGSTVLVVGGDMPFLVPAVLRLLLAAAPAALADSSGALRPLPCALDRAMALLEADQLLARGERRLRTLLNTLDARLLARPAWQAEDPDGLTLVDIDERADLDRKQRDSDRSIGVSREEEPGP